MTLSFVLDFPQIGLASKFPPDDAAWACRSGSHVACMLLACCCISLACCRHVAGMLLHIAGMLQACCNTSKIAFTQLQIATRDKAQDEVPRSSRMRSRCSTTANLKLPQTVATSGRAIPRLRPRSLWTAFSQPLDSVFAASAWSPAAPWLHVAKRPAPGVASLVAGALQKSRKEKNGEKKKKPRNQGNDNTVVTTTLFQVPPPVRPSACPIEWSRQS